MKITWSNAVYAMSQCARFTARLASNLKDMVSILPILSKTTRLLSRTFVNVLGGLGTLSARSPKGFNSRLKGVARELAVVIGISLSIAGAIRSEASIVPLKKLANYQLTDKQYKCHNQIVYIESRWNIDAIGNKSGTKQAYGYYQLKSKAAYKAPYDKQFYLYWYYVSHRYGLDYEIPDYCKALKHLKTKGWA